MKNMSFVLWKEKPKQIFWPTQYMFPQLEVEDSSQGNIMPMVIQKYEEIPLSLMEPKTLISL